MSATPSSQPTSQGIAAADDSVLLAEIDASCRVPLLVMFVSAAVWAALGSLLATVASVKFHMPAMLADCPWLTYGRIWPAATNCLLYGFGVQAGLGVALWLFARLGRTHLAQPIIVTAGAALWNFGVTIGIIGILAGDSTGFETLEIPGYGAMIMLLAYLVIGVCAALTFHFRRERQLFVSQWYLLAALFWFPWIYSTAYLLLVTFPVRGVAQAVIAYWYANNLEVVWMGLVGLAIIFYLLPRLTNRELNSYYLVLFIFWMLLLFGTWGGIPNSAPLPAWMPTLSTSATLVMVTALIALALTVHWTLDGKYSLLKGSPILQFIGLAAISFGLAELMRILGSVLQISQVTDLTWFGMARVQLAVLGFFGFALFAAIYSIMPCLLGLEFSVGRVRAHFWVAALGIVFLALPLAIGGIVEGLQLQRPSIPFLQVLKTSLMFIRLSTVGDLLILVGQLLFFANVGGQVIHYVRAKAAAAYAVATADLYSTAEVKP